MKTGVIDVGGGLRGIYAAGVFDYCMDEDIRFDLCIGISAGSANLASYLAGQKKRNIAFFSEYPFRGEYMSLRNFLFKKTYLDLDYIYGTLSNSDGENPIDYDTFINNPAEFLIIASNALTGETKYFRKHEIARDSYDVFKASSAIPFICHPYAVDGIPYYDGALGDTIPIEKAFEEGCDKVVLVLTRPMDKPRTPGRDTMFAKLIRRKYPEAAERLIGRADRYNRGVELAREYAAQGRVLIIAPDDTCGMDTLSKNKEAMAKFYDKGYRDGAAISAFLEK